MRIKIHFHINSLALSLAWKQRIGETRKMTYSPTLGGGWGELRLKGVPFSAFRYMEFRGYEEFEKTFCFCDLFIF